MPPKRKATVSSEQLNNKPKKAKTETKEGTESIA